MNDSVARYARSTDRSIDEIGSTSCVCTSDGITPPIRQGRGGHTRPRPRPLPTPKQRSTTVQRVHPFRRLRMPCRHGCSSTRYGAPKCARRSPRTSARADASTVTATAMPTSLLLHPSSAWRRLVDACATPCSKSTSTSRCA
eukprot:2737523-Prymnesium_polylepis.1